MSFVAVGAGVGALSAGFGIYNGIKQNNAAKKIKPDYQPYTVSPYAQQQLGLAQQLYNGRMAGAADQENNIAAAQANTAASAQRNATSGTQALAVDNTGQVNANNAYNALQIQEAQNKIAMLGNLNQAYQGMTNENDKVYQDKMQKYQQDLQMKAAYQAGAAGNIANGINSLGSMALLSGELNNTIKKGNTPTAVKTNNVAGNPYDPDNVASILPKYTGLGNRFNNLMYLKNGFYPIK